MVPDSPVYMNRILSINKPEEITAELENINVSSQGVLAMQKKARGLAIKLKNVKTGAANIIKQDMLGIGGDAAVARGVVNGKTERSDVIVLGNENMINKLIDKLSEQHYFEIPQIRENLRELLDQKNSSLKKIFNARGYKLSLNKTLIMAIANISPDSFYDGGKYDNLDDALFHIEKSGQRWCGYN